VCNRYLLGLVFVGLRVSQQTLERGVSVNLELGGF